MIRAILIGLLLTLSLGSADAISCYTCSELLDSSCAASKTYTTSTSLLTCANSTASCVTFSLSGKTVRGCSDQFITNPSATLKNTTAYFANSMCYFVCATDGCNSVPYTYDSTICSINDCKSSPCKNNGSLQPNTKNIIKLIWFSPKSKVYASTATTTIHVRLGQILKL